MEFDEHTHGISLFYTDTTTGMQICDHVTPLRAISLLAMGIVGIADKFGISMEQVADMATKMAPELVKRPRNRMN